MPRYLFQPLCNSPTEPRRNTVQRNDAHHAGLLRKSALVKQVLAASIVFIAHAAIAAERCDTQLEEATPTRDFKLNNEGTAEDTTTGLLWSRCSLGQSWNGRSCVGNATEHTFPEAFEQVQLANNTVYLGATRWRLPSAEELQTLVEVRCSNPSINETVFPNTPASWFWSGSRYPEFPWYGQPVDFGKGNDFIFYKIKYEEDPFPVRLVRDAPHLSPPETAADSDNDGITDALEISEGTDPTHKDNAITQDERFIAQVVRDLLQREVTTTESTHLVAQLRKNPSRVDSIFELAATLEFQEQQLDLAVILRLLINQEIATRKDLQHWRGALQQGRSSLELTEAFMLSSVLRESYQHATPEDYSTALARHTVGRALTASEQQTARDDLQTMTRSAFTRCWLITHAFQQVPHSERLVILVAALLADYPLDSASLAFYSKQLDSGALSLADLINLVLTSAWYSARFME